MTVPCARKGTYTLSEAWSGVNWADLMAAQGAFESDFYDRSTRTIVDTMLWTEYRPVIKIGPKGALGNHEIRPIHSAPSLGQSILRIIKLLLALTTLFISPNFMFLVSSSSVAHINRNATDCFGNDCSHFGG